MRNRLFIAALALALFSGIAGAGEPDRRMGDRPPREFRNSGPRRDGRGPRARNGRRGPGFGPRHGCPGFGPMAGGPGFGPLFMDELALSAEQTDKIIDVMAESFRDGLALRVGMRQARNKARELRKDGNASADAIIAINRDIGELRGKMEALRIESGERIESVLTPEQLEKMKDFRRGFGPARGDWGSRHRRGDTRWDDEPDASPDDDMDDE